MTARDIGAESLGSRPSSGYTKRRNINRFRAATVAVAMASTTLAGTSVAASASAYGHHSDHAFRQVDLVSDLTTLGPDVLVDPAVKNPWGIAMGPTTPLWVDNQFNPASNCGSQDCVPAAADLLTKVTLYKGATNSHDPIQKVGLEVTASSPFGIVFNPTSSFSVTQNGVTAPARFLFNEVVPSPQGAPVAEITGWSNASTPTPTVTATTNATKVGAVQTGLALVPGRTDRHGKSEKSGKNGPRLLAADGANGVIDVYDGNFKPLMMPGAFVDPHSAADGLAPYNVAYLKGRVYVTYATQGVPGGAVSVFTPAGRFIKRLVSGAPLNGPWGLAIAPKHWGGFGGALLVGNVDSGMINAFNPRNGHLLGTLSDAAGKPLVNPGLWGLAFGNGTIGTPQTLLFAAGIGEAAGGFGEHIYEHGLVGLIKQVDND
jgi:uncharacterized protein (TIGR03118 family)